MGTPKPFSEMRGLAFSQYAPLVKSFGDSRSQLPRCDVRMNPLILQKTALSGRDITLQERICRRPLDFRISPWCTLATVPLFHLIVTADQLVSMIVPRKRQHCFPRTCTHR
jgi:hypothetical protein